jgi:hypothetical protein
MIMRDTPGGTAAAPPAPPPLFDRRQAAGEALKKLGLSPKLTGEVPQIGGDRVEATIGAMKPGQKVLRIIVHIGSEATARKVWDEDASRFSIFHNIGSNELTQYTTAPGWQATTLYYTKEKHPNLQYTLDNGHHFACWSISIAMRQGIKIHVNAAQIDTLSTEDFKRSLGNIPFEQLIARMNERDFGLCAGRKEEAEDWLKKLIAALDAVPGMFDGPGASGPVPPVAPPPAPIAPPPSKPAEVGCADGSKCPAGRVCNMEARAGTAERCLVPGSTKCGFGGPANTDGSGFAASWCAPGLVCDEQKRMCVPPLAPPPGHTLCPDKLSSCPAGRTCNMDAPAGWTDRCLAPGSTKCGFGGPGGLDGTGFVATWCPPGRACDEQKRMCVEAGQAASTSQPSASGIFGPSGMPTARPKADSPGTPKQADAATPANLLDAVTSAQKLSRLYETMSGFSMAENAELSALMTRLDGMSAQQRAQIYRQVDVGFAAALEEWRAIRSGGAKK